MKNEEQYYDFGFFNYPWKEIKKFPDGKNNGIEKYQAILPVKNFVEFSLGEGATPLTKAKNFGKKNGFLNVYIKHEELNPTGSFKDRESVVAIALAARQKKKEIIIASSGNAGLSLAAYAQKAGIKCTCFVPTHTTKEKKNLISLFGAQLKEITGNYEQVYRYVVDHFDRKTNLTAGICAERIEGNKTIAFEIWEKIGVPDVIVVPCGNGGALAGIWRGFFDLFQMGKITQMPKMVGVQVAGAAPLAQALKNNKKIAPVQNPIDSIAEGIVAEESYCSPKVIEALQASGGSIIEVSDSEIRIALKEIIATESLIPEPTSAAAFAAVKKLGEIGIKKDSSVVIVNTGSGLKMLSEIASLINSTQDAR